MKAGSLPLKICFIAPKAYSLFRPENNGIFGGAELDLYMLAIELAKDENFQVSFIVADYGQNEFEVIYNVRVIKSVGFQKSSSKALIKLYKAMQQADADIYLIKTASPAVFAIALWCRLRGKIFIYRSAHKIDCDGTYIREHLPAGLLFKFALKMAKVVIVQKKSDQQNLFKTLKLPSLVIPNGHRLNAKPSNHRNIILWVGREVSFKRPELFIELSEKFPTEKFVMICKPTNYQSPLENKPRPENLEFIRQVPFSRIDDYFRRAKIFVCTSQSEGFANTYIQACKNAVPILSLEVNPDGFLEKYNCGMCCGGRLERFADYLRFMLEDDRYIQFGKNARKYAEQNHNIENIIERYKELFFQYTE